MTARRPFLLPGQHPAEGPTDPFPEEVRQNLAGRRTRLDELMPAAIDLAKDFLVVLHRGIVGRQEALRGDRAGSLFRRSVRGEDALPVEDLARLAIEAPTALGPALAVLAHRAGYRLEPAAPLPATLPESAAKFAETAAHVTATERRASADGLIEPHEAAAVEQAIELHKRHLATLEGTLAEMRRAPR